MSYVRHGLPIGYPYTVLPDCTCPSSPCGGVKETAIKESCPEHGEPIVLVWHWAKDCPGEIPPRETPP